MRLSPNVPSRSQRYPHLQHSPRVPTATLRVSVLHSMHLYAGSRTTTKLRQLVAVFLVSTNLCSPALAFAQAADPAATPDVSQVADAAASISSPPAPSPASSDPAAPSTAPTSEAGTSPSTPAELTTTPADQTAAPSPSPASTDAAAPTSAAAKSPPPTPMAPPATPTRTP